MESESLPKLPFPLNFYTSLLDNALGMEAQLMRNPLHEMTVKSRPLPLFLVFEGVTRHRIAERKHLETQKEQTNASQCIQSRNFLRFAERSDKPDP
jgi:hypothetical protein